MQLRGKDFVVEGHVVRVGRLAAEGFVFVDDPDAMLADIAKTTLRMDLFTFLQKLPAAEPAYGYPMEWDNVAAMPVSTFEYWWTQQIDAKTRNMVRRADKKGLALREAAFDEALVRGIWEIYNECPMRQGRPFPHYGKDFETVWKMSASFPDSSFFIGAYLHERLVGFAKLTVDDGRSQAAIMHLIALMEHRDKGTANALIAEAVRACERRAIPHLVYSKFSYWKKQRDSLSDFKERNGLRRVDVPRYYVPLTRVGLHRRLLDHVPEFVVVALRRVRSRWHDRRTIVQASG